MREIARDQARGWRKTGAIVLFAVAALLFVMGLQSVIFHSVFPARTAEADQRLLAMLTTGTRDEPGTVDNAKQGPYLPLLAELEAPPRYLRPTATRLAEASGLLDAVRFNASTYLAQVGERGTARVLLSALQAAKTDDPKLAGLVAYSLGRLRFELFRDRPDRDNYLRSVEYLRQSLRADPQAPLARLLFEYLSAMEFAQEAAPEGQGNAEGPAEGERASDTDDVLIF